MTLAEIEGVSFSVEGFGTKSPTIWAHIGNELTPLCYLRRPKNISDELWDDFLRGFDFSVKYPPFAEAKQ
jgi:hypothetical protein